MYINVILLDLLYDTNMANYFLNYVTNYFLNDVTNYFLNDVINYFLDNVTHISSPTHFWCHLKIFLSLFSQNIWNNWRTSRKKQWILSPKQSNRRFEMNQNLFHPNNWPKELEFFVRPNYQTKDLLHLSTNRYHKFWLARNFETKAVQIFYSPIRT